MLAFLAKGPLPVGRVLPILGKNGKKDDNGDDGKSQLVTQPSGPREVTSSGKTSFPTTDPENHPLLTRLSLLSLLPIPRKEWPICSTHSCTPVTRDPLTPGSWRVCRECCSLGEQLREGCEVGVLVLPVTDMEVERH